jgi:hypothetical protein
MTLSMLRCSTPVTACASAFVRARAGAGSRVFGAGCCHERSRWWPTGEGDPISKDAADPGPCVAGRSASSATAAANRPHPRTQRNTEDQAMKLIHRRNVPPRRMPDNVARRSRAMEICSASIASRARTMTDRYLRLSRRKLTLPPLRAVVAAAGSSAEEEAQQVAANLVETNLRGHDSHGVGAAL